MKSIKRYLPQLVVFIIETLVIWALVKNNIAEVHSAEFPMIIFVIIVMGYGLVSQVDKTNGSTD